MLEETGKLIHSPWWPCHLAGVGKCIPLSRNSPVRDAPIARNSRLLETSAVGQVCSVLFLI